MTKTELKQLELISSIYEGVSTFVEIIGRTRYSKTEEGRMSASTQAYYLRAWLEAEGVSTTLLDAIENEWIS